MNYQGRYRAARAAKKLIQEKISNFPPKLEHNLVGQVINVVDLATDS